VKSRRRHIVNLDIGLAVGVRRARMQTSAPGADVARRMFMILGNAILQGRPHFPHDLVEVRGVIKEHHVRFVYVAPWVRSVSGGLRLQNTHDARRATDPLLSLARALHCSVLAVARPYRGEGDLCARVGLSVLRQAARLLLFAIEPPDDDTQLIVGNRVSQRATRSPANRLLESATRSLVAAGAGLGGRRDHRRTRIDDPAVA
jgi:hypothetical protein